MVVASWSNAPSVANFVTMVVLLGSSQNGNLSRMSGNRNAIEEVCLVVQNLFHSCVQDATFYIDLKVLSVG